jgi:broad specificity phosphatase PhoE
MDIEGSTKCFDQDETVKVILLRHGETEGNVKGIVQGQWDTPLTAKGIESTLRKAEKIQGLEFDAVFCSDLSRTVETLEVIQKKVPGLAGTGLHAGTAGNRFRGSYRSPEEGTHAHHFEAQISARSPLSQRRVGRRIYGPCEVFFTTLKDRFPGGRILAVTHYGVMETAAKQFESPPSYDNIQIGADDVWLMCFAEDGSATREVL